MSEELTFLTAEELVVGYREKRFSPREAADAVLARMDEVDGNLTAFCHRDDETVRAMADESTARWTKGEPVGPLDGVPVAVKDVLRLKGWPTRLGSKTVDAKGPWEEDSPGVASMRAAGTVFLGMTKTPELGWKGVTDCPLYGMTRNPWNLRMTPGGSSGGSAAAVAAGCGPIAFGTDGGGSVRIPAGFCGIVGLKPTFGRVPVWPPSTFGLLSHVGPMARTVKDAALMLDQIAKPDPRDSWSLAENGTSYAAGLDRGVAGLRIAWSPDLGFVRVDPEIARLTAEAARRFEDLGATVEEVEPGFDNPEESFRVLWYAATAAALRTESRARRRFLDFGLATIAEEGATISAMDWLAADKARNALAAHMAQFHTTYDLLLTPTLPIPAFECGIEVPQGWPHDRWYTWTPLTYPFNMTRQPALTVPCGFTEAGLPAGLQIVGPRYADALVLAAGHAYQTAHPLLDRWPNAGLSAKKDDAAAPDGVSSTPTA
jgi:aspartyl-tRNA(Asn)/glutamyl-tRNA(Gln) amidotransferase subunit A